MSRLCLVLAGACMPGAMTGTLTARAHGYRAEANVAHRVINSGGNPCSASDAWVALVP